MKIVKKIAVLTGAVLLAASMGMTVARAASLPDIKVAVVDRQQILQQSPRVAAVTKKLETNFKARQAKIGEQQKALQNKMDKFKKESPTMSKKDKDAMEKKISTERSQFMSQVVAYQKDLQAEQGKMVKQIMNDLDNVVSKVAESKHYSLVLEKQAVVYYGSGADITQAVEKAFNGNKS